MPQKESATGPVALDSFAILALLNDEAGADKVQKILERLEAEGEKALLCTINWGEVLYIVERRGGKEDRRVARESMEILPVQLIDPDLPLVEEAASIKARVPISYADAFCAALAIQRGAAVLTGDPEFEGLAGEIRFLWLP